jgi:hypothetical protein
MTNLDSNHRTSAPPAWRDALWHVIHAGEWKEPLEPTVLQNATTGFLEMLDPPKKLSPGEGAYNEAHYCELDWEVTFALRTTTDYWISRASTIRLVSLTVENVLDGGRARVSSCPLRGCRHHWLTPLLSSILLVLSEMVACFG